MGTADRIRGAVAPCDRENTMRAALRSTLGQFCKRMTLALMLALPAIAGAQVYKCVDPSGHTTYQQTPCPPSAKGGRVELFVDNGASRESADDEAAWESAAREKNVMVGMPRRYVRVALGAPRNMRPGKADENAAEVWSYPQDMRTLRLGFRNGAVAWMRHDEAEASGEAALDDEATQRVLRRRSVGEGQDCSQIAELLGRPDATDEAGGSAASANAPTAVTRYTWEPAAGDPFVRTIITCSGGRVTYVERISGR